MDALYFPRLSLPRASWTNPNLLFFERIHVIAPTGDRRGLFDHRTRELIDRNIVVPIDPGEHAVDHDGDEIVLAYLLGKGATPNRGPFARIHAGKIAYSNLANELIRSGLLSRIAHSRAANFDDWYDPDDHTWLEGPVWVVEHLMNVLALRILARREMSLITDRKDSHSAVIGMRAGAFRRRDVQRRARAIRRLLPAAPDLSVQALLDFRGEHQTELRRFRRYIDELATRRQDTKDFHDELLDAEMLRERLAGRLARLPSRIEPAEILLSVASVAAPLAEQGYYSAAVTGFGLAYLVLKHANQNRAVREREAELRQHKLIYAALASRTFDGGWAED